jgi:hypothetical protein
LVYTKVLTATEVLQNFNATRSRFGIWCIYNKHKLG